MIFAHFWIKMSENTPSQPTIIQMMIEIADQISSGEYRAFKDKYIVSNNYMPHTLVTYIFNISLVFIRMAKNPMSLVVLKLRITSICMRFDLLQ